MKNIIPKYNRGQQRAIIILGFAMLIGIVFFTHVNNTPPAIEINNDSILREEVRRFEESLVEKARYDSVQTELYKSRYAKETKVEAKKETFRFNPNTLDSSGFVRLGFKPFIARNILRYREKGGEFFKASDLKKIYYIDTVRVDELSEMMLFDSVSVEVEHEKVNDIETVEINSADTTLLQSLPHIGRYRAMQIERYRRTTGGYYSVTQILEACNNMTQEELDELAVYVDINTELIKKLDINTCSMERLKAHPYISFYQAKAIYELRWEKGGKLDSIAEIKALKSITTDDWTKLKYYLETK